MSSEALTQELIQVEQRGWDALCTDEGAAYYREHLTDDALMAFPFGVMDRSESLDAMDAAQPWSSFQMKDTRVISLGPQCGVVVYSVTAQREGEAPFSAIVSSTFVRTGGHWKLAFHQQSFE